MGSFLVVSMLKLLVYAKIEHMGIARIIVYRVMYHEIYKFVSDGECHQNVQFKSREENVDVILK